MRVVKFDGCIFSVDTFVKSISDRYSFVERGFASRLNLKCTDMVLINDMMHVRVDNITDVVKAAISLCDNGDWFSIGSFCQIPFGDCTCIYQAFDVTVYDVL